jgi:A/G-specific adenine glycosylase
MQDFSLLIRLWYRQNSRPLPWRATKDPYFIWLSEIILQQTRVEQGRSYYEKFIKNYPFVEGLAKAEENEVLNLWQGLGYYSRARNLHFAAKQIVDDFKGEFPTTYKGIKSLKGVGDYTAAAIASFAFGLPHAVVDGNVYRVLSRYFADETPIDTSKGQKLFKAYAQELLSEKEPAEHNQAIMELGAMVCKPKNPDCLSCPINESCLAHRNNKMLNYPVKSKKVKVKNRYFNYLVAGDKNFQLEKRSVKGIWQNMYQFPLHESEKELTSEELRKVVKKKYKVVVLDQIATYTHVLSHQKIYAIFWSVKGRVDAENEMLSIDIDDVDNYPLPRLIHRFLEENNPDYGDK